MDYLRYTLTSEGGTILYNMCARAIATNIQLVDVKMPAAVFTRSLVSRISLCFNATSTWKEDCSFEAVAASAKESLRRTRGEVLRGMLSLRRLPPENMSHTEPDNVIDAEPE
mmetsp:Transcript_9120/g.20359  ORF Transcript_9120/g.20359 Transcript_9120/m.20359 type:complete len:112 (+) Transcript_9120:81-416(+)